MAEQSAVGDGLHTKRSKSAGEGNNCHKIGATLVLLLMAVAIGYFTYTVLFNSSPTAASGTGTGTGEQPVQQQQRVELHVVTPQASLQQLGAEQPRVETPEPPASATPPPEPTQPPVVVEELAVKSPPVTPDDSTVKSPAITPDDSPVNSSTITADEPSVKPPSDSPPVTPPSNTIDEPPVVSTTKSDDLTTPQVVPLPPSSVAPVAPIEPESWRLFKQQFGRSYTSAEEEARRRAVFEANLQLIETHNANPNHSFKMALNHLADLTRDEINDLIVGPTVSWATTSAQLATPIPPPMRVLSDGDEPLSFDWRNLTGEPPSGFPCRASAVFAVVANVEAALVSQLGRPPVKLSEAQVLACLAAAAPPNSLPACMGFVSMLHVFELLRHLELVSAQSFARLPPNSNPTEQCQVQPTAEDGVRIRVGHLAYVHRDNMLDALASGPLTVAVDASQSSFHFYHSGHYLDERCQTHSYNLHALLVGASPESLVLRTSLGPNWGEGGHLRLARRPDNRCLPQEMAIQPQLLN